MCRQSSSGEYNADVNIGLRTLVLLFLGISAFLSAQEVRFIDLSNIQQRTTLRFPPVPQTDCKPGESCVGGGVGGGSVGDGAPDPRDPHALGIAIDRVTPTGITRDPFEADLRILNTGLVPIDVPVSPHLTDLQPSAELQPFPYLSLALVVRFGLPDDMQAAGLGWVELYGSAEHEETILRLQPGQWVRVKAMVKLHSWPSKPMDVQL